MKSIPEAETTELKLEGECFKDVVVQVRHTLSLEEALGFVHDIVTICADDETAEYSPELFSFAVRLYVLMYYTNIDLTKDVKKAYRILYGTNIYQQIYSCVDYEQCSDLVLSAEQKISHRKRLMESSVAGKVSEMLQKMDAVMAGSEQMMEAIDSDSFKEAVARLTDGSILKNTDAVAHVVETESDATAADVGDVSGNIVYLKKKK